ncbi:MAG: RNHCP domain-containing protein [Candidatus Moranbacteria bacterium]|nr:RNHCP domain-containing protein [Candidatus Moranbacteria bacterium]
MMTKQRKFQRRIEDFVCEKCGSEVKGNGYTDHCPVCLWGRHVDVNPGDRAASCGGMMEPMRVNKKGDGYTINYRCAKCEHQFEVKLASEDNFEALVKINQNHKS